MADPNTVLSLEQFLSGPGAALFAGIRTPFGIFDRDCRILWLNRAMAHIHRCHADESLGRPCQDVFRGCDVECVNCPLKEALALGRTRIMEGSMDLPGGRRWGEMHAYPIRGNDKSVSAVIAIVFETTAHRQALEQQRDYSRRLERRLKEKATDSPISVDVGDGNLTVRLSPREKDVLRLISEGYTNAQIGELLLISGHTVKTHVNGLFNKLGVNDRTQAAVVATRAGIV